MPAFVPTTEQKHALDAFAVKYGTTWRDTLTDKWMKGHDANEPGGHLLRQVRNHCGGPKWLFKYTPDVVK